MAFKHNLLSLLIKTVLTTGTIATLSIASPQVYAEETTCARVKIEIKQELTLERQAFDAEMKINNTTDTGVIENVGIDVKVTDELGNPVKVTTDPNDLSAQFFLRVSNRQNIDNITGTGKVNPQSTATINWLLIPAPGAAGNTPLGKKYLVGATLKYTYGGENTILNVSPDVITVKPLPKLNLDYFLERNVMGDDPLTEAIEPVIPFTLGVRVKNSGIATAKDLKIESAQPKIIENKQGLLIDFKLLNSYLNDLPVANTLNIDFGNIEGSQSKVGRWNMTSSLFGKFTEFTAKFTHSDELGGQLTSIIEQLKAHSLIKDVLVDLPGRDSVKDFLADDDGFIRVYESSGLDTDVTDRSSVANFSNNQLSFPPTDGFVYVKLPDPYKGKYDYTFTRSDAKQIRPANIWLSQTRNEQTKQMEYWLNLFDINSTGSYRITGEQRPENIDQPPTIQFIPNYSVEEDKTLSFMVEASSVNGKPISLSVNNLPNGATFEKDSTSTDAKLIYNFTWKPAKGTVGDYSVSFSATDSNLTATKTSIITVKKYSPPPGPVKPVISEPLNGVEITTLQPNIILSSMGQENDTTTQYDIEVYKDSNLSQLVHSHTIDASLHPAQVSYKITKQLDDNQHYFWRVRAYDGKTYSNWENASFFVNTVNDTPTVFNQTNPEPHAQVDTITPILSWTNSSDADGDKIIYQVSVYKNSELTELVTKSDALTEDESGTTHWSVPRGLLENHQEYYWLVSATDTKGATQATSARKFIVNTSNSLPTVPQLLSPKSELVNKLSPLLTLSNSLDNDNDKLHYTFEVDEVETFDSANKLSSNKLLGESSGKTTWLTPALIENKKYYWRAKADDGFGSSDWVNDWFRVDVINEAPGIPVLNNPSNNAWVSATTPTLSINASVDPEENKVDYEFEIYKDSDLQNLVSSGKTEQTSLMVNMPLADKSTYWWRVRAVDDKGLASQWSNVNKFYLSTGVYQNPSISITSPNQPTAASVSNGKRYLETQWTGDNPNIDTNVSLYYSNYPDGSGGIPIVEGLKYNSGTHHGSYQWDIGNLSVGTYYISAIIYDDKGMGKGISPGALVIAPSNPSGRIEISAPLNKIITSEDGLSTTIKVKLSSQPTHPVKVNISSSDVTEGIPNPSYINFTPQDWAQEKSVNIVGQNDCISDGFINYTVNAGPASSFDPNYMGLNSNVINATNMPNLAVGNKTNDSKISLCGIQVVAIRKPKTFEWEYDLRPILSNEGVTIKSVVATLTKSPTGTKILRGTLNFGAVGSQQSAKTNDVITLKGGPLLGPLLKSGIGFEWNITKTVQE
jgi:hypothetical protein